VTTHSAPRGTPSPEPDGEHPGPRLPDEAETSPRNRISPWRSAAAGVAGIGAPTILSVLHPLLGGIVALIELTVVLTIFGTALFGSETLSQRAFRLLRWMVNRPEPPAPEQPAPGTGRRRDFSYIAPSDTRP
jgi:hypothetical protein